MTYKDDLDIIQAAEGDSGKMTLNAITELDNKGLLGRYSEGGGSDALPYDFIFEYDEDLDDGESYKIIKHPDSDILDVNLEKLSMALKTPSIIDESKEVYYPCAVNGNNMVIYDFEGRTLGDCRRNTFQMNFIGTTA